MGYKLKYVGSEFYPKEFVIPTYFEIVKVIDGIAEVELEVTKDRLLKEGFVLYEEVEKKEQDEKKATKKKEKKVIEPSSEEVTIKSSEEEEKK